MAMADFGVMEICWDLDSLSPLRDRLIAFFVEAEKFSRSASDNRDKREVIATGGCTFILFGRRRKKRKKKEERALGPAWFCSHQADQLFVFPFLFLPAGDRRVKRCVVCGVRRSVEGSKGLIECEVRTKVGEETMIIK